MKTVAIVQARMGSSRLPGKVLKPLLGLPMLVHVIERAARSQRLDHLIVAIPATPVDQAIAGLCRERGWPCFQGSEEDVLDRYEQAVRRTDAHWVVRITADCPLVDPDVIDRVVDAARQSQADYAANGLPPPTFPRGLDVEVMTRQALATAWREDRNPAWREHVTPFLYRHPERFRLCRVAHDTDLSHHRWTVDTPEDFELVRRIYHHFGHNRFSWEEVLTVLAAHPEWTAINRHIRQKTVP